MPSTALPFKFALGSILLCLLLRVPITQAQEAQQPRPPEQSDEVIRVSTDLVQTDVMVFDKQGRFIDNLKPEQFELRVDGKVQPVAFFERVVAGTIDEDAQLAAARGGARRTSASKPGMVVPLDRGRTFIFFVDDLHLSSSNIAHMRNTILRFIDSEMRQNDVAMVATASAQPGFLQQLTDNKTVLRAAVARIKHIPYPVRDLESPPMSEAQALAIDRNDQTVTDVFIDQVLRESPVRMSREQARRIVMTRATTLLMQAASVTTSTLVSLENLVRQTSPLPGRKLFFFISDGFLPDSRVSNVRERLRRVTDASARAGVVIYTLDAQGLGRGLPDAGNNVPFDPFGRLEMVNASEAAAMQDPLYTLALDTGGRAFVNTNNPSAGLSRAVKETSIYYLLAWQPEQPQERTPKFHRVEVSVKDRPDLVVLVRRGFFSSPTQPERVETKPSSKKSDKSDKLKNIEDKELVDALKSLFPISGLPTSLALGYFHTPEHGLVLTASVGVNNDALAFETVNDGPKAVIDVGVLVLNDKGDTVMANKQQLTIVPIPGDTRPSLFSQQYKLTPGLYQVRVASRDKRNGRTGSAMQWIEIPDFNQRRLNMSSLFLGERRSGDDTVKRLNDGNTLQGVPISPDRRFSNASYLRVVTYIYNALADPARPVDVAMQVQIFRDDQPVMTAPLSKIDPRRVEDPSNISYGAEIALVDLPVGRYALQVTAIDRNAKTSATQRVNFVVE